MYLTYCVHLAGIKISDWLQECTDWKASKYTNGVFFIVAPCILKSKTGHSPKNALFIKPGKV
jgi:hypothetical protein